MRDWIRATNPVARGHWSICAMVQMLLWLMTNVTSQRGSSMSISGHTQSSQDGSADAIGFVRATRSVRRRDRLPNPKPRLGHEGAPLGQCGRNQTIESLAAREGKTE